MAWNYWGLHVRNVVNHLVYGQTHRSNTKRMDKFNFQHPDPVSYEFCLGSLKTKIMVPFDSEWQSGTHFHLRDISSIQVQGGELTICRETKEQIRLGLPEEEIRLKSNGTHIVQPAEIISWRPHNAFSLSFGVTAILKGPDDEVFSQRMVQFYHTICSVIYDAQKYCQLQTTPAPIRSFYSRTFPFVQEFMTTLFLEIQLRVVYWAYDHNPYDGRIPFTLLWRKLDLKPPRWAAVLELRSIILLSKFMTLFCVFIGYFLGMRSEYDEYNIDF